jgi:hypothetical protein
MGKATRFANRIKAEELSAVHSSHHLRFVIVRSLSLALKPQYAISPCSKLDEKEEETAAAVVSYIILLEKSPFFSSRREKRQTPGSRRVASAEAKHVRRPNKLVAD